MMHKKGLLYGELEFTVTVPFIEHTSGQTASQEPQPTQVLSTDAYMKILLSYQGSSIVIGLYSGRNSNNPSSDIS